MNRNTETKRNDMTFIFDLNNEDVLDLSKMPVDVKKAEQEIKMSTTHLSINQEMLTDSDKLISKIPIDMFKKLHDEAEALRGISKNKYVTVLEIHFGIDSQNRITLFFEPLYCENLKPDSGIKKRVFTIVKRGLLQSYNGIAMIPDSDPNNYRTNYEKSIEVRHNDNEKTPSLFIKGKDTESVIFSFQELLEFINANPIIDEVFIYNSIRTDLSNSTFTYKHTLLLSPEINAVRDGFIGKFANLAHLCPPHCSNLEYDLP